jgi:hypothetical protein
VKSLSISVLCAVRFVSPALHSPVRVKKGGVQLDCDSRLFSVPHFGQRKS